MNFFLFGLNHKTSPVEVRERLALTPTEIEEFTIRKKEDLGAHELLTISTCNRTELYGTYEKCRGIKEEIHKNLLEFKGVAEKEMPSKIFYYSEDDEAVKHLFRVTAGIDSMIIGETQILAQVKDSYSISTKIGSNGPIINRVFHQAFRVGKRARTETKIGEGIISVSHAAVALSKKIFSDLKDKSILLVGAGETGELALKHFMKEGIGKIWVTNRTFEKAKEVSERLKGSVVPFNDYKTILGKVDIAIFSTSSENYLLTKDDGKKLVNSERVYPLFIIDISVPRNVDPKIAGVENIFLYDIDDLESIVNENKKMREEEISKVEKIIDEEISLYRNWMENLQFEPLLKFLKEEFENIRKSEIEKNMKKFNGSKEDVDMLTKSIVNKIINRPLQKLRRFNISTHSYILRSSLLEELFKDEDEFK